ncbi:hypothetical protein [Companilactobacillus nuruki]|nr:hypothetical protein [Companilactobacillus nuruki]
MAAIPAKKKKTDSTREDHNANKANGDVLLSIFKSLKWLLVV